MALDTPMWIVSIPGEQARIEISDYSPESEANARLIAAAPELLSALTRTAQWCHQGHGDFPAAQCGMCKPILAAIAKARGQ
jgi:hypothetical protein